MKEKTSARLENNDYTPLAPSNNNPAMVGSALYSLPRPEAKTSMSIRGDSNSRNFGESKTQVNFFKKRNLSLALPDGTEKPSQINVDVANPTQNYFKRRHNST